VPPSVLARLRKACLAFPETHEVEAWQSPTFRVKNKIFAMFASKTDHHGGGRNAVWIKCTPTNQQLLITTWPARFFKPPYVGPSGWIGVYLDPATDWDGLRELLRDGYLAVAPAKVKKALLEPSSPTRVARKRPSR
jgi:predicted DNA-binding protein (MmcQ/YjbR family)